MLVMFDITRCVLFFYPSQLSVCLSFFFFFISLLLRLVLGRLSWLAAGWVSLKYISSMGKRPFSHSPLLQLTDTYGWGRDEGTYTLFMAVYSGE